MSFRTDVLREIGGFDPALGAGTRAKGGDDLAVFFDVIMNGDVIVYEPGAIVRHAHRPDFESLRRQSFGYGVGLGVYFADVVPEHPRQTMHGLCRLRHAANHFLASGSPGTRGVRSTTRRSSTGASASACWSARGCTCAVARDPTRWLGLRRAESRLRELRRRLGGHRLVSPGVPVLMYHSVTSESVPGFEPWEVTPAIFAAEIGHLVDSGYDVIPLEQLRALARRAAENPLPPKPVVITFDDGYVNFAITRRGARALRRPVDDVRPDRRTSAGRARGSRLAARRHAGHVVVAARGDP